ncbi:UDP-3-O-[3-hydroxymyristoyl] N-acetylglucosamine deacetylase [Babesia bigemina]|uniref:UDP-3-O-[3-hydroxymyristoyl] N-acetylglucosamine deacetylase n=1 Tax=Babesia bigemina TaxID=5866 RepID=A0A061D2T0_BABBI|nr:UDP-3-O-[3-hydroxymyristoyl] N-acetylglucosamine deacetylase [Babesia bigemina]CDR94913.1 UDP-3-O-[3-hydroxymyristoyl] N-acetylglucosamine deacetylase [Babesia bigemina]|eukprot:XP_012767099.1 UDP-3-O-[3-hydroxymyristoyl] N-acetylglucosamine deacetylase [Babesia bigemina]
MCLAILGTTGTWLMLKLMGAQLPWLRLRGLGAAVVVLQLDALEIDVFDVSSSPISVRVDICNAILKDVKIVKPARVIVIVV